MYQFTYFSIGGRFLTCDCNMIWITEWIKKYDLQVTSRERNPQFCGNPQTLQDKNFYQLNRLGKSKFIDFCVKTNIKRNSFFTAAATFGVNLLRNKILQ